MLTPDSRAFRRIFATLGLAVAVSLLTPAVGAAAPSTLAVQGVLRTSGGWPAADGKYAMTASIYADKDAKTAAWQDTVLGVQVASGTFSLVLGASKPLDAKTLAGLKAPWIGIALDGGEELPRSPVSSVPYAVVAGAAASLSCSGCLTGAHFAGGGITAQTVAFTYASSQTKGGPADKALDLQCSGCVSVSELKFDGDVDLGGKALKAGKITADDIIAKTVSASKLVGDGSGITGITIPSGKCSGAGEVVSGINQDGSLLCVKALDPKSLPPDSLDEISNGLLTNQFADKLEGGKDVPIPDNSPDGVTDTIDFPDIGVAQKFSVQVHVANSDAPKVKILLFDPKTTPPAAISKADLSKLPHYLLYEGGTAKGKDIQLILPAPDKPKTGDLGAWIGKNPVGKWRLVVIDSGYLDNKTDGAIKGWSIAIQTLSNKKVQANGALLASKGAWVDHTLALPKGDKPPVPCDAAHLAHMYADTKAQELRFCNGKTWTVLTAWGLGESAASAGVSCKDLFDRGAKKTGTYWIKPFGTPIQALCDMAMLGGGWTMVFKYSTATNYKYPAAQWNKANNISDTTLLHTKASTKLWTLGNLKIPGASRILAVVYKAGVAQSWWGFQNVGGDLNASWKKDKHDPALTKVNLNGYDASLISLSAGSCREFYITNNHGGCGNDAGSLVVNSSGCGPGCSWEKSNTIQWWGGPGDHRNYTNGIAKDGEVLVLYVR